MGNAESMNILVKADKFYFKLGDVSSYNINNYRVNGEKLVVAPFNDSWYVSEELPKTLTLIKTNRKYTDWTIREDYKHLNLPETATFEHDEDDELPSESMFYNQNYVDETTEETTEIKWDKELEEDVSEPVLFDATQKVGWGKETIVKITPNSSLLSYLTQPDIVLPSKPCALTGDELYKIVRHYIKQNIDPKYAKITSDYDFCFTVKKLLAIPPENHTYNENLFTKRKPKYKQYTVTDREVEVFEMTPPSEKYKGYTVIKGIQASSHEELKNALDAMLSELIAIINEPLKSCDNCDGTGIVKPTKAETNGQS